MPFARRMEDCEVAGVGREPPHGFLGLSAFQTGARRLWSPRKRVGPDYEWLVTASLAWAEQNTGRTGQCPHGDRRDPKCNNRPRKSAL
jgi:hypothetical protein